MVNRKILIRFDDVCPTMNWEQWNKAMSLLEDINASALLGVIPDCKDPELQIDAPRTDFWDYIKLLQDKGHTIAMHGYNHIFSTIADGIVTKQKISEFAGLPYEEQLTKIRKGKDFFCKHGIDTEIFFAPAHSYDDNTLRALHACNFKYISDGLSSRPYIRQGIICLPCRTGGIPVIKGDGYYTVVLHTHEWTRPDKSQAWKKLKNLCANHQHEIVSFETYCTYPIGNAFFQQHIEKAHALANNYIIPILSQIKHSIF